MTHVLANAGLQDGPKLAALDAASGLKIVPSHTGAITPFTMRVDRAPFNDVRVRQALRLLVDRPQLIDSALDGYGVVAFDVFSPYDPDFDTALHREQDIPTAKALLKAAGHENLTVQLVTSPAATSMVVMATVLKEQANAAGVNIQLSNVPSSTFFGKNYLSWTFSQDFYNYSPYLARLRSPCCRCHRLTRRTPATPPSPTCTSKRTPRSTSRYASRSSTRCRPLTTTRRLHHPRVHRRAQRLQHQGHGLFRVHRGPAAVALRLRELVVRLTGWPSCRRVARRHARELSAIWSPSELRRSSCL